MNNSTELFSFYNTYQTAVSLVNRQKPSSYRNNTTWGNQLAHTPLGLRWRLGCSASPVWVGGWGVVCLSGPGVCVILAVCQSGLGNGHRVITPALTASSISLYHSCKPPPPPNTHYLFSFSSAKEQGRENDWVAGHHKTQQRFLKSQWDNPAPLHT